MPNQIPKAASDARRARFVEAYIANGGNGTAAAKTAGFSVKAAYSTACKLMKEPAVAKAIAARQAKLQEALGLTTERVLKELARIALYDPRKLFKPDGSLKAVHELDDDTAAAIGSVEVDEIGSGDVKVGVTRKLKAWDKNAALEKAMKHLGMFEKDNSQSAPVTIIATVHDETL